MVAGCEFDGKVACQMNDCGLGSRVTVCCVRPECVGSETGDGGSNDDARGGGDGCVVIEERSESRKQYP